MTVRTRGEQQAQHPGGGRSSWHRRASRPVTVWMLVLLFAVFFHRWLPEARWTLVHVVALGLITNSILIWSQHFTEALLKHRLPDTARPAQLRRIRTLNLGVVVLIAGMMLTPYPAVHIPAVLGGAVLVGGAVAWHATSLGRQLRAALPARFAVTVRWYIIAAWLLPVGAVLGAVLGVADLGAAAHARVQLAHEAVNVLGFVGLTVTGTLLTLWPTILRTRMPESSLPRLRVALGLLLAGVLGTAASALVGWRPTAAAGLGAYALGVLVLLGWLVTVARTRAPRDYAGLSVLAGICWLLVGAVWTGVLVLRADWAGLDLTPVTPVFVAGFLVQMLLGAMTYLLPATMGGGPAPVRAGNRELTRLSWLRVTVVQLCLILFVLPPELTGSWVRAIASILGVLALAAFLPLMIRAVRAQVAARREMITARAAAADRGHSGGTGPGAGPGSAAGSAPWARPGAGPATRAAAASEAPDGAVGSPPSPRRDHGVAPAHPRREILAGAGLTALGVAAGLALDPSGLQRALHGLGREPAGTGHTTRVAVKATAAMRFEPAEITVPAGDRLILEVTNADETTVHDLVLDGGATSGRLDPGASASVDAGVITQDVDGWCSIVGHRQMGMTLRIRADGASSPGEESSGRGDSSADGQGAGTEPALDLQAAPGKDHRTRSAVLDPAAVDGLEPNGTGGVIHRMTLTVTEQTLEVAPGVALRAWTYNGDFMGPTLRGRVGDTFEVTLINRASMGHSVDFHAGDIAPDQPMRTIAPGESLEYRFTAHGAGIWLYHCSTAPMSSHIAAGMFGAVVVDPPELPTVDREFLLVHSETYLKTTGRKDDAGRQLTEVDPARVPTGVPTLAMFNGHATQYAAEPLEARTGQRVRIWTLAAGPSLGMSFHVVGGQFTTVYKEGAYRLLEERDAFGRTGGRAQALDLASAQGGFVELTFTEPGTYIFVNHSFAQMERGARGLIRVE